MHYPQLKDAWSTLTQKGAPFEIAEIMVRGVPVRTYVNAPPSVRELWLSTAAFGQRDYLVYEHERLTYAEAHAQVTAIAAWLFHHGVRPGHRVALAMRNYPEWILAYWACVATGVAVVGMNAWWTAEEMAYCLKDAAPKVIIVDRERLDRLGEHPKPLPDLTVVGVRLGAVAGAEADGVVPWSDLISFSGAMPAATVDPDADACIFYTSGTTGFPKGAQLTHRGCIANLFNVIFSGKVQTLAVQLAMGETPDPDAPAPIPTALLTTPLFHVTANNCGAYPVTAGGGKIVLMRRWDAGEALRLIERERVTAMSGVPVMSRELIAHPDMANHDLSSLTTLGGGGAQLPPDLVAKIDASVATARPNTGYGMTETCGIITAVAADFFIDKPDSAGPVMPTFEARCVDDLGADVPAGSTGELWVRGSPVIKGYINRPEATAETITDGWLHTGDLARIDSDGFVFIVDRKKDMVLRGGENIYSADVEACIYRHPAVAECCVFSVPDQRLGEEVGAAVVLRSGESATASDLREHCHSLIARYKAPRYIWFLDQPLPRNANGKFLKRELKAVLTAKLQDEPAL